MTLNDSPAVRHLTSCEKPPNTTKYLSGAEMTESLCGFQRPCAPSTGVPSVRRPIARARPPDRASSRPGERRSSCWGSSDDARARELGATRSGPIPTLPASDAVVQFSERPGERSKGRGARIHGRLSCPCALRKRCVCTTSYPSYITPAAVSTHTHPIALATAFDDAHVRARTRAHAHTHTHTTALAHQTREPKRWHQGQERVCWIPDDVSEL